MVELKDSGIEWCNDIPKHWQVMANKYVMSKYKEICPIYHDEDILSLTMKGVIVRDLEAGGKMPTSFDGYQKIYPNNLLMCLFDYDVTPRCIGLIKNEGLTSPAYSQFIMKNENSSRYYYYYYLMIDNTKELLHLAKNLRHSFTEDQLGAIKTPVPPAEEQNKIADFLDNKCAEIDAISSEIQEQINTLEEYKKSLIKELLDNYLNTNKHIYSKLWHLSKLVTKQTGFDYSNIIQPSLVGELTENTIPYLQTRHFKDNYFNFDTEYYVPKSVARLFPQITLNKKCLLFSIVGASIGNVAIFPATQEAFLGGAVCKVDLINEQLYDYIKHYMMSIYGQEQILTKINASAQGTITVQNVRDFKIPIFENEQVYLEFSNKANKISSYVYSAIADKQKQLETLEEYKKTLIYEYVTGKKEVA